MGIESERRPTNGSGLENLTIQELLAGVAQEGRRLLRAEIDVAKHDLEKERARFTRAGSFAGAGGALLYVSVFCFAAMLISLLALALPTWVAALIVTVLFGGVGALMVQKGRQELRGTFARETRHELQEDLRWMGQLRQDVKATRHASA